MDERNETGDSYVVIVWEEENSINFYHFRTYVIIVINTPIC